MKLHERKYITFLTRELCLAIALSINKYKIFFRTDYYHHTRNFLLSVHWTAFVH